MEDTLFNELKKLVFKTINNIYLMDIVNDVIYTYKYEDTLINQNKQSLSEYLQNMSGKIEASYVKEYMNNVSVPKLMEKSISNGGYSSFAYKLLNGETYKNTSSIVNIGGNDCVLVLEEKASSVTNNKTDDTKYNSLIEVVADAMLKVHNVYNMDERILANKDGVRQYVDSIFSGITNSYPELKKAFTEKAINVSGREDDTILIVDDDKLTRTMIKKIFEGEYKIVEAADGREAIDYLKENDKKGYMESSDHVVSIFLDLTMPVLDGFAVLTHLSQKGVLNKIPVIIISGDYEKETKSRVYSYNIADMLEKPFDFEVVRHRIKNFINLYKSSNSLDSLISGQTNNLKNIIDSYIKAYMVDYKEDTEKVAKYAELLANKVMSDYDEFDLSKNKIEKLKGAITYYDIGFYSVPRTVLSKDGNYTEEELAFIKNYPVFSSNVLDYVLKKTNDESYKDIAKNICKHYHENFDGTGFPNNLSGNDIPIEAQIAAIAIAYNNLRKTNYNPDDYIIDKSGTAFNPKLVGSFMKISNEFRNI